MYTLIPGQSNLDVRCTCEEVSVESHGCERFLGSYLRGDGNAGGLDV